VLHFLYGRDAQDVEAGCYDVGGGLTQQDSTHVHLDDRSCNGNVTESGMAGQITDNVLHIFMNIIFYSFSFHFHLIAQNCYLFHTLSVFSLYSNHIQPAKNTLVIIGFLHLT